MKVLPATLGTSDEHYRRLGVSRDRVELWENGMRTDGARGTYESRHSTTRPYGNSCILGMYRVCNL